MMVQPKLSDFFDIRLGCFRQAQALSLPKGARRRLPLAGGDKPRHYKRSFTEQVGAGFIPARELACIDDNCRRKFAKFSTYLLKSHHVCT
jgi:hypothetical protein